MGGCCFGGSVCLSGGGEGGVDAVLLGNAAEIVPEWGMRKREG